MKKRPLSISIVSWLFIATGAIILIMLPINLNNPMAREIMARNPLPFPVQLGFNVIGALVSLVCGVAVLKAKDWGRTVFIGWSLLGLVIGFLTSPIKSILLISLLIIAAYAFFLFRKPADEWFGRSYFGGRGNDPAHN